MHRQLTVAIGLIENRGKFLLTRRFDPKHVNWHQRWELPGGKIDSGETPLEALHREIWEETQLLINSPKLLGVYTHHWQLGNGTQQTFILLYHCLSTSRNVTLRSEENDAFVWEKPENILKMDFLLDGTDTMLRELYFKQGSLFLSV